MIDLASRSGVGRTTACGLLLVLALGSLGAAEPAKALAADEWFAAGEFARAEKAYIEVPETDPGHFRALVRSGYIALLMNRLAVARARLEKALAAKPGHAAVLSLLAEAWVREDAFDKAAPLFKATGRTAKAAQLESFRGAAPYVIEGAAASTSLEFLITDPLPLVEVRLNGGEPVNFFIDTGGAEVIVDAELAKELKLPRFGSEGGTFAGGKKASFEYGRADSLTLGDFTVRGLPVHVLPTRPLSDPIFGGRRVDGIIGTVLLYHFLATIDYPGERLVLRRRGPAALKALAREMARKKALAVPFWLAGDHYMVARGTVNRGRPMLFFVDTGLAGGGFTCPESTLKEAGISLEEDKAGEGIGGGGKVRAVPFVVKELSLGKARERDVRGIFSGPFPLEKALGFRLGGLISHGFFRPYALTFDFDRMRLLLHR